jgi:hypothetical protein
VPESGNPFNSETLVKRACQTVGGMDAKINAIEKTLLVTHTEMLQALKLRDPSYYGFAINKKELYLSVLMVGFENDFPFIVSRDFITPDSALSPASSSVIRNLQAGPVPERIIQFIIGGRQDGINSFWRSKASWNLSAVETARFIVAYEILDEPLKVGSPIEVLSISKGGHAEWVQHETCDTTQKREPQPPPKQRRQHKKSIHSNL